MSRCNARGATIRRGQPQLVWPWLLALHACFARCPPLASPLPAHALPPRSYKRRFKLTATGKVLYPRPGHVHKRFNKTKRQLFELSGMQVMKPRYAKTVKKIGFKLRHF